MKDKTRLSDSEIEPHLTKLSGWERDNDTIYKEFTFDNFVEAFGFMARVALIAESENHHPDWSNSYKTVRIAFTTHEVSGLSELDFKLAEKINLLM